MVLFFILRITQTRFSKYRALIKVLTKSRSIREDSGDDDDENSETQSSSIQENQDGNILSDPGDQDSLPSITEFPRVESSEEECSETELNETEINVRISKETETNKSSNQKYYYKQAAQDVLKLSKLFIPRMNFETKSMVIKETYLIEHIPNLALYMFVFSHEVRFNNIILNNS